MLEARQLWKRYGSTVALQDCTLTLRPGRILGLLGPNGAGKTTLLRILSGILPPDSGAVLFEGEPLQRKHLQQLGYLPEERGLYRRLRVGEQLLYLARLRGLDAVQARQAVFGWLERLGAQEWYRRRVEELSKGMQQKVQLVAALVHHPRVLLLDEPTSGLDPINASELGELLRELRSEGRAIVLSTHRMEQVEEFCDDVVLLHRGRVLLQGEVREIKRRWGRDTLTVEFSGDLTAVLSSFPNVRILSQTSGRLELRWSTPDPSPQAFLRLALEHAELHAFRWSEPSMREIFLDVVTAHEAAQ
ncbi:ABC transporter ATP-binding protein NatA [bacterium HR21]|nr:ABC transporter ATP-binding protein NatA [bacterium HR21]